MQFLHTGCCRKTFHNEYIQIIALENQQIVLLVCLRGCRRCAALCYESQFSVSFFSPVLPICRMHFTCMFRVYLSVNLLFWGICNLIVVPDRSNAILMYTIASSLQLSSRGAINVNDKYLFLFVKSKKKESLTNFFSAVYRFTNAVNAVQRIFLRFLLHCENVLSQQYSSFLVNEWHFSAKKNSRAQQL